MQNQQHPLSFGTKLACLLGIAIAFGTASVAHASDYEGTYVGTFKGSDHGSLTIVIDEWDAVTCDVHSAVTGDHFTFTGGVSSPTHAVFSCIEKTQAGLISWLLQGSYDVQDHLILTGSWWHYPPNPVATTNGSFDVVRVGDDVFADGFE